MLPMRKMLSRLNIAWCYVRQVADLTQINGLILPGGESSTALLLLHREGLDKAIRAASAQGLPLFGTCAGAILLAKQVLSPPQASLGLVDVSIQRNAYGRQLASHVAQGQSSLQSEPMEMVFIRAPRFLEWGENVKVIASLADEAVCLQQDRILLATFHPELTTDRSCIVILLSFV